MTQIIQVRWVLASPMGACRLGFSNFSLTPSESSSVRGLARITRIVPGQKGSPAILGLQHYRRARALGRGLERTMCGAVAMQVVPVGRMGQGEGGCTGAEQPSSLPRRRWHSWISTCGKWHSDGDRIWPCEEHACHPRSLPFAGTNPSSKCTPLALRPTSCEVCDARCVRSATWPCAIARTAVCIDCCLFSGSSVH